MCCVGKDCASWHNRPLPYQTCGFSVFNLTLSCDFNRVCHWNRHVVLWHCCWLFLLSHGWPFKGPSCVLLVSTDYWRAKAILTMESLQKWATKVYSFISTCWKRISLKTSKQIKHQNKNNKTVACQLYLDAWRAPRQLPAAAFPSLCLHRHRLPALGCSRCWGALLSTSLAFPLCAAGTQIPQLASPPLQPIKPNGALWQKPSWHQ